MISWPIPSPERRETQYRQDIRDELRRLENDSSLFIYQYESLPVCGDRSESNR